MISRSWGNVMTADPCRSGVTAVSLSLEVLEVVVDPVKAVVDRLFVLSDPRVQGAELFGCQAVDTVATLRPASDQSHLAQDPEVLGDLRLRQREVPDQRPDRLLAW